MAATSSLGKARAIALGALCLLGSIEAYGLDYFDGTNLTVPMANVGGATYANAVITVTGVVSAAMGTPTGNFDFYIADKNQLFIPSVLYAGTTYTNVTVGVGNISHVGGVMTSPSYIIVSNANDNTLASYSYGAYSQSSTRISSVDDPALAGAASSNGQQLYLDKTNGLLFHWVPQANGTAIVTTYRINLTTGQITATALATKTFPTQEGNVDATRNLVFSFDGSASSVNFYPYNTATGVIQQAASATQVTSLLQTTFSANSQDGLLYSSDGAQLTTYSYSASGINLTPVGQVASSIDSQANADDVTGMADTGRKLIFISDSKTSNSSTTLTSVLYTATSLGPVRNTVSMARSAFCGIDPVARLLFMGAVNAGVNYIYAYATDGTIAATSTAFTPTLTTAQNGGCSDIDPVNHVLFYVSTGTPTRVSYYVYDTTSGPVNVAPTEAGSISLTAGSKRVQVLSTNSVGMH